MSRLSPAQRHFSRVMAEKTAAASSPGTATTGSAYELMLAKLANDRGRLHAIQSIERKNTVKLDILPDYQDWTDGVLAGGNGAQDDVLTTILVWHIDVGNYTEALRISEYALPHKLSMPDQYNRDLTSVLLDEISGSCLNKKLEDPEEISQTIATLSHLESLTKDHDAPDQARAKLYKALGYALLARIGDGDINETTLVDAEAANQHLHRALELFDGIGVKQNIERLEKRLKKAKQG